MEATAAAAKINPWANWTITGGYHADNHANGATCDHCGAWLMNIVTIVGPNCQTGRIGLDCADRVGLNATEVRAMLAAKYAAGRREAAFEAAAPTRAARAAAKAERDAARAAADAADEARRAELTVEDDALTDLAGNFVPCRLIRGKFGITWMLLDTFGGESTGTFITAFPKRASTMEGKGYREVRALFHIAGPDHRPWADRDLAPVRLAD